MEIDFSALSDEDLDALEANDFAKISDAGLSILENASDPSIPTPFGSGDNRVDRELNMFQKGVNTLADVLQVPSKPYKERVTQKEIQQEGFVPTAQAIAEVPLKMGSDLYGAAAGSSRDFLGIPTIGQTNPTFGKLDTSFTDRLQNNPLKYNPSEKGKKYYKTVTDNLAALPATSQFSNISKMSGAAKNIPKTKLESGNKFENLTNKANKEIQLFINKPYKEQLIEFNKNIKKNKRFENLSNEGYQFIPSQINNARTMDKLKESALGSNRAAEIARETNQKVTNNLTRKYLGVSDDTPLDFNLLDRIRKQNGKIYAKIDNLPARPPVTKKSENIRNTGILDSKGNPILVTGKADDIVIKQYRNGREILEDLKTTRYDSTAEWSYFKRQGDPATRKKAVLLDKKIEKLEDELIDIAKYNNKENLIPELKGARVQIAKAHLIQKSLNDVTGNVDAKVISKLAYQKKLLDPNIQAVAKMYMGYPKLSKIPESVQQSPFTVLDIGISTFGVVTGNPLLAVPAYSKFQASKSLFTPKTQRNLAASQVNEPAAKGIRSLLQIPNLRLPRPKSSTLSGAGLASLIAPLDKENQ